MNTVETQETLRGIAARVREMREIEGLTQAELAARTGVTEASFRATRLRSIWSAAHRAR